MPEFFSEILLEAKAVSELNTPEKELDRKLNKIYEINLQLDALSERLGLLPKSVNPKHVFDQMEKLSVNKQNLEAEVKNLNEKSSNEKIAVSVDDFSVFKLAIEDLLENEADPKVKTAIIQKVVHKIIIKNETFEVYFYVGEKHYKRELAIASSLSDALAPEKRQTNPLPVFHGNPKTSELLFLKPNVFELRDKNFYDAGSNSLKNGSENVT